MSVIVSVKNVTKVYMLGKTEVPALRGVSLDVERGRVPLHRRPLGLRQDHAPQPDRLRGHARPAARCVVDGQDTAQARRAGAHRPAPAHSIGFIFQSFNLVPVLVGLPERRVPAAPRRAG